jgi:hypothetical protein
MSTRNLPAGKEGRKPEADLTAICEPVVLDDVEGVSQPYGPSQPVTRIALSLIKNKFQPT